MALGGRRAGIEADMVLLSLGALAVGWLAVVLVVIGLCVLAGRTDRPLSVPRP